MKSIYNLGKLKIVLNGKSLHRPTTTTTTYIMMEKYVMMKHFKEG
jgi:hypothetical protein